MPKSPEELLRACERARRDGKDFPSIWLAFLKRHPLVLGPPSHEVKDGDAQIVVRLLNGQRLLSTTRGFSLG